MLTGPVLPPQLLSADWPGAALRSSYTDYQREMMRSVRAQERGT
ncbi:hypothetical protein H8R17_41440 [Streptomyces sp. TRM68367]|nr:hypothetical protein [Streptomyces sp. TRM68367]